MLDPNDFTFYGYEDAPELIRRRVRRVGIRAGEPTVSIVENGIFVPAERNENYHPNRDRRSVQFKFISGIADAEGWPVEAMHLRRSGKRYRTGLPQRVTVKPQAELGEEVVCLGWLFNQFGHVLLESLARIWYVNQIDPSVPVVFQNGSPRSTGVAQRVLETFGVPRPRILVLDKPTRLRRAFIPEPLYELNYAAHERAAEPHRAVAERILDGGGAGTSEQPLYLSRRLLPSGQRTVVGEDELEDVLRENGFLIAHPELMTIEDQIRLFNKHSDIFACEGSAVYGALFALRSPRLHVLSPSEVLPDYFLSSMIAGAQATFINCLRTGRHRDPTRLSPHLAETPKLVDYLKDRGLLKSRYRAAIVAGMPHRQHRYDEAWFFMRVNWVVRSGDVLPLDEASEVERLAKTSWLVSLALARYFAKHDPARVDGLVTQFLDLLAQESHLDQLARYARDVADVTAKVVEFCEPTTVSQLAEVLAARFAVSISDTSNASKFRLPRPNRDALARDSGRRSMENGPESNGDMHIPRNDAPLRAQPVLITSLTRESLLSVLSQGGIIAEVGVFRGAFSAEILRIVEPDRLHLIDPWGRNDEANPRHKQPILDKAYDRVERVFHQEITTERVVLHRDFSTNAAATFPDHYFDWIYIDAMHDYDSVLADLMAFKDKVKSEGFILGHDFSNYRNPTFFGVIPAVREFTRSAGFALVLVTNEKNPSYLLARSGNNTTLPKLKESLLSHRTYSGIEVAESLFDRFMQVRVTHGESGKGRLMRFE